MIYQHPMGYLLGLEGLALPVTVAEGYDIWSPRYDTEENDLLGLEQPVVWGLIDQLPAGTALDAACGTGRHARHLAGLGHTALGVDASAGMLAVISDSRMDYPVVEALPDGGYGYLPHHRHATSEYLTAALPAGLQVRHCEEMRFPSLDPAGAPPPRRDVPDHPSDIWALRPWCPAAFRAAYSGSPLMIFWKFQRADG